MVTPKQIGMLDPGSRDLDLVVKKASKMPWHDLGIDALPGAEPRCGCAPLPNRTMFPPSPGVTMLFDADYGGIQAPRISNKPAVHRLFSSPRLAYFCDVCAAQILSDLELGNNFAARSPNSMISRSLNDRCANCWIASQPEWNLLAFGRVEKLVDST